MIKCCYGIRHVTPAPIKSQAFKSSIVSLNFLHTLYSHRLPRPLSAFRYTELKSQCRYSNSHDIRTAEQIDNLRKRIEHHNNYQTLQANRRIALYKSLCAIRIFQSAIDLLLWYTSLKMSTGFTVWKFEVLSANSFRSPSICQTDAHGLKFQFTAFP